MGRGRPLRVQLLPPRGAANCETSGRPRGPAFHDPIWSLYGLALAPLGKEIRDAVPRAMQAWYADDCAMAGKTGPVAEAMTLLERLGPARGYYPEPEKA